MVKKRRPLVDSRDLGIIRGAVSFSVVLFVNRAFSRFEFSTLEDARRAKSLLPATVRRPLLYAYDNRGYSALVPDDWSDDEASSPI